MNLGLIPLGLMKFSVLYYDIICYVMALCIFIVSLVFFLLFWGACRGGTVKFGSDNQFVELGWTIIPTFIVLALCVLKVKFITSGLDSARDTVVKVVGHQ